MVDGGGELPARCESPLKQPSVETGVDWQIVESVDSQMIDEAVTNYIQELNLGDQFRAESQRDILGKC